MKNLSTKLLALLATGLLSVALFTQDAQAAPLSSDSAITFIGSVNLSPAGSHAGNATGVTAWYSAFSAMFSPQVGGVDGDFVGFVAPGAFASFAGATPWSFNSGPLAAFWAVGGFTFDLISSSINNQTATSVSVSGTGTISGNGFDPTEGTWEFTTQNPGTGSPARFTFSAATGAVPEGGATLVLLGVALTGIEVLRRKVKAKA